MTAPEGKAAAPGMTAGAPAVGAYAPAVRIQDEGWTRSLRSLIGDLLRRSRMADLALARVRLAALDLTEAEVRGPTRCRVLLGQLDATMLVDATAAQHPPAGRSTRRDSLVRLADWLASDRLEVRSAGIGLWTPDFSIFRSSAGAPTCLLGAHYFGSPQLAMGPSFTAVLHGVDEAALLQRRFEEVWDRGHDVSPAIIEVLERTAEEVRDHDGYVSPRSP